MSVGHILSWAVCGLIVGLVARLLVRGGPHLSLLATMALGIAGSLAGGFLSWLLQGSPREPFSPSGNAWAGWIMAIIGAALMLWIYRALNPRRWWQ